MSSRGRILIVDDNDVNREILCRILRRDYDLETAADGTQCIQHLADFRPQLVLLDIMMPGTDGYEVCRQIKSQKGPRFVQVILVSGKGGVADRLRGYESLADDYLTKPFDHAELRAKVQVQFRMWNEFVSPHMPNPT